MLCILNVKINPSHSFEFTLEINLGQHRLVGNYLGKSTVQTLLKRVTEPDTQGCVQLSFGRLKGQRIHKLSVPVVDLHHRKKVQNWM